MWKWILKTAFALGFDKWAEQKAVNLTVRLKRRTTKRMTALLDAVGKKVEEPGTIVVRMDRDCLRPGMVVLYAGKSHRVSSLLMVNKLGAFYEAKVE